MKLSRFSAFVLSLCLSTFSFAGNDPKICDQPNQCDDSWTATSTTNAPTGRYSHTAVWTGSEMIVWGGYSPPHEVNTGGRYNPSTDSWAATSTDSAPNGRSNHTAVWTGSEMIVWGGTQPNPGGSFGRKVPEILNTGGKYDPSSDSWTAISTTNAPSARIYHTAVWTGSEMIVWGGIGGDSFNTGGRYNPSTDTWTATSTTNAPAPRYAHTAVWTGTEMIVWGGEDSNVKNTGGRYNPSTDSWTATSTTNAPDARSFHTAVWTGTEMVVWGGGNGSSGVFKSGGRYNPEADSWTATNTTNASAPREGHTAVWTGSEMIVWGGVDGKAHWFNTGGRYNPGTDDWTATSTTDVPGVRNFHTAVWTDNEMIVWGGAENFDPYDTGGRYCAQTGPSPITLDARVHRRGGKNVVVLTWTPADGGSMNVLRDGVVAGTTDDDGALKDWLGTQTGTFIYQVCETDLGDCSNEVAVTVPVAGD